MFCNVPLLCRLFRRSVTVTIENGTTYYLHERKGKSGNTLYHFSQQADGAISQLPEGKEITQLPNGVPVLRNKRDGDNQGNAY